MFSVVSPYTEDEIMLRSVLIWIHVNVLKGFCNPLSLNTSDTQRSTVPLVFFQSASVPKRPLGNDGTDKARKGKEGGLVLHCPI